MRMTIAENKETLAWTAVVVLSITALFGHQLFTNQFVLHVCDFVRIGILGMTDDPQK
jgi:hypothetical protein